VRRGGQRRVDVADLLAEVRGDVAGRLLVDEVVARRAASTPTTGGSDSYVTRIRSTMSSAT
jgi:hypothetical protein